MAEWINRNEWRLIGMSWSGSHARINDPFNLFAGRLKRGLSVIRSHFAARMGKQHAREYLGLCRYLANPTVLISCNRWRLDGGPPTVPFTGTAQRLDRQG